MPRRTLRDEIKQGQPFGSPGQEAVLALLRTTDVVRRRLAETVGSHDLTLQQYNVLRILRGAGKSGLPTLEIATRMIERTPGITRLIDRLEKRGLVRRARSKTDRRTVFCHATPQALRILGKLDEPVAVADDGMLGALSDRDLKALIRLLELVREATDRPAPAD